VKRAAKALELAIRCAKEDPLLQAQALMLRAGLQKDPDKKLADLNEAVRVAPGDVAFLRARASVYSQAEKFPEALADLDSALKFEPKHAPTLEAKAMVLGKMKKFDEALALIDRVQKLDPKSVSPLVHRARIHAMKPDLPAALKDLDEAHRREPGNVAVLLLRASVYQEMKENEKAMADVDKILALRPDFDVAMRFRASLLAGEGKFGDAIAQVEELLKGEPGNPEARLQLALLYTADQKYEKAIKIFTELIEKDPAAFAALRGRGDALLSLGKHAEAIADYERAYKLQPHDAGLLNNFAWVLCTSPVDKLRNGKRALELAKEACRLTDYKQAHILSTLGAAYAEIGDFNSAMEWSKKAIALGKEDQKEALAKELESYKAGKPMRELKTPEPAEKPQPQKDKKAKPADKPKTDKPKP
jgi:tetratricopeptide (TPR) repeat protein